MKETRHSRVVIAESALLLWGPAGVRPSAWRQRCCVPVCPPGGSVALRFSWIRLPLTLWTAPPPPPSPVCPSGLTFAVNCLCFLSFFHTPPTFSLQHLCFCAPLLLYRHPLLPPPLCHLCLSPLITWALAVARQKRSGLMVSEDFRALLISTGYSLVLLLAWCCRGSAGPRTSELNLVCLEMTTPSLGRC